jgi:hypothetical protein
MRLRTRAFFVASQVISERTSPLPSSITSIPSFFAQAYTSAARADTKGSSLKVFVDPSTFSPTLRRAVGT